MRNEIRVRDIRPDIKMRLEELARKKGISLNELVKNILEQYLITPEQRNLADKYEELAKQMLALYQADHDEMREVLAENAYYLKQFVENA